MYVLPGDSFSHYYLLRQAHHGEELERASPRLDLGHYDVFSTRGIGNSPVVGL